jgi:SPOR domain
MADDTYSRGRNDPPPGRGGARPSAPSTDPLTELARLIGQSDPFATDGNRARRADPSNSRAPMPDWRSDAPQRSQHDDEAAHDARYGAPEPQHDSGYGDGGYGAGDQADQYATGQGDHAQYNGHYADEQAYGAPPYQQDQPYYDEAGGTPGEPGYDDAQDRDQGGYGAPYFGTDEQGATTDGYYDETPAPRRRGWLATAAAFVGLAVIGTAGAFAYRAVFTGGPPSVISRSAGPDKIVPAQNSDSSQTKQVDRLASGGQDERMAPPAEQPLNIPDLVRNAPPPVVGPSSGPTVPPPVMPAQAAPPSNTSALASASPSNPTAARKIRTVTIRSDQSLADSAAVRPVPPRAPSAPAAQNAPLSLSPQSVATPAPPPPRTTAAAVPIAAVAPPAAEAGGAGGYFVQVTAQKTQEEAQSSYRSIQAKYASVLSGRTPVYRRKDLGGKGVFYGAQIGPLSHEDAVHLCESLKSAGGPCMVQRN